MQNEKQNSYSRHSGVWTANGVAVVGDTFLHRKEREESRRRNGSDSPTCSLIIDPTRIVFSIVSIMMALVFLCSVVSQPA